MMSWLARQDGYDPNAFDVPGEQTYDRRFDETWPGKLAQDAMGAVLAPGRALQSTDPITTEQMIKPAADLAGLVMGGGIAGTGEKAAGQTLGSSFTGTLYHGSPRTNLHYLNPSERGPLGPGVYTSPAEQISKGMYAGEGGATYTLPQADRDIYMGHGHRTDAEWFGFKEDKKRLLEATEPDKREAVKAVLDKMWSNDGYPTYQRIRNIYGGDEGAQALYKKAGFEGVSGLVDGPETLLFGPRSQPVGGVTLGSGATDKKGAAAIQGIRAYHSSPHDFDKFDLAKIGSGEGAQAYGHGLYFAESPAVSGQGGQYWQQFLQHSAVPGVERSAANALQTHGFDRAKAVARMEDLVAQHEAAIRRGDTAPMLDSHRQALRLLKSGKPVGPRTYEVNINADPAHLLDWDKPLAQMSPDVQRAFGKIVDRDIPAEPGWAKLTGEKALRAVGERARVRGGGEAMLREAGIPGIKYLDQGSRVGPITGQKISQIEGSLQQARADLAGGFGDPERMARKIANLEHELSLHKPTSNYVIFDPNLIRIDKKYAVPGAIGAGGMGALAAQNQYEEVY